MTRQVKTPKQRAEEALAVADRKVVRLAAAERQHRDALAALTADLAAERRRRDFLAKHPDLQEETPTP